MIQNVTLDSLNESPDVICSKTLDSFIGGLDLDCEPLFGLGGAWPYLELQGLSLLWGSVVDSMYRGAPTVYESRILRFQRRECAFSWNWGQPQHQPRRIESESQVIKF